MDREYSVWNATVAALWFWTADLEVHVLSSTIKQVYNVILLLNIYTPITPAVWQNIIWSFHDHPECHIWE